MSKKDICSYNYDELKEEMLVIGEKAFRSKQRSEEHTSELQSQR